MRYLLDTHVLIWFLEGNPELPLIVQQVLRNPEHTLAVSFGSYWEMAIKMSLGKLELAASLETYYEEAEKLEIEILQLSRAAVSALRNLPFHHKDPFDRLFIATALREDYILVSADRQFQFYEGLQVFWEKGFASE